LQKFSENIALDEINGNFLVGWLLGGIMFWWFFAFVAFITFVTAGPSTFAVIGLMIVISTLSVVFVSKFLIGEVNFGNALKANIVSTFVGFISFYVVSINLSPINIFTSAWKIPVLILAPLLSSLFVYSRYLETKMAYALVVFLASFFVNGAVLWFVDKTLSISTKALI